MRYNIKKYENGLNRLKISLNQILCFLMFLFIMSAFISGCASMQQPSGGPRDSIPPKIVKETPANLTKNFTTREIEIEFDEYVKLNNEFTEFSISPDVDATPELRIKKKSLFIKLPDTLAENTTYSLNFGKGLVDVNESNPLLNYSYVFSTGDEIDSLTLSGNVISSYILEPEKDIVVLLIPIKQDSIFGKRKANIFTRTDSSGNFQFKNLSENTYRIYALKENNNDRIYNSPDEEIGFLKDSIVLDKNISGIKLSTFKEIPADFRVMERKIEPTGRILLSFNKPVADPSLRILNNTRLDENKITEFTKMRDSAFIWLPELTFDTLEVELSQNSIPLDTILLRRNKNDKYERAILISDNLSTQRVDAIKNVVFTAAAPIESADISKIKLLEDTIRVNNFQLTLDNNNQRKANLTYRWRPRRTYLLELEEGAFIGHFGEKSQAGQRKFTFDDTENYGDIILNVQLPDSNNYIIELIKEDKTQVATVHTINSSQKISYKQFPGGNYSVRVIYDDNANQIWDTGNLAEKRQPEQLWYWNKIITIRPNWEQEEIVTVPAKGTINNLPQPKPEPDIIEEETNPENNGTEEPFIKSGTITPKEDE
ncbi:Ig-like domain-containing domain [Albibacterium bauzanense]|uniref:Ig-like domain-containing protein n=1 Tax=Albibacterium bauzanense TaxID=653929 RepID=A0A4R1LWR8_9SPHI|nr:Ig-like domain-containing domain [Albibacterium bauzanense]TCK82980.1 Ig-like domain-containing protein [Albibacterium bauzanense]